MKDNRKREFKPNKPKTLEDMIKDLGKTSKDKIKDLDKHISRQLNGRKKNTSGGKKKKEDDEG